jgi:hypothetical protein
MHREGAVDQQRRHQQQGEDEDQADRQQPGADQFGQR